MSVVYILGDKMSNISKIIESRKHYDGVTLMERLKECHTPAISIAIIDNYKICDVYTHGVKRRMKKDKITANTFFKQHQ